MVCGDMRRLSMSMTYVIQQTPSCVYVFVGYNEEINTVTQTQRQTLYGPYGVSPTNSQKLSHVVGNCMLHKVTYRGPLRKL